MDAPLLNKMCFMIGPHRSGSSVVRAVLDAHPSIVMGSELGRQNFYNDIIGGATRDALLTRIVTQERNIGKNYTSQRIEKAGGAGLYRQAIPGTWQGRHRELKVIGDKSGPWIGAFAAARPDFESVLKSFFKVPIFYVHTVRNPWDNLATMKLVKQDVHVFERWCRQTEVIRETVAKRRVHTVHMDDLSHDPEHEIEQLYRFLDLARPQKIVGACAAHIFEKPKKRAQEVKWTDAEIEIVQRLISELSWLSRYPENPDG